jgi:hypothetical protein
VSGAVVVVGMDPAGLELELFQPVCGEHEPPWRGPVTFDVDTAKANARVHNADRHEQGAA